ncbi:hypothetical protein EC968_005354 [Mortierella alpina]|nr:hypothetical protein EC968_005354 [Mortierella alpina]
MHQSSYSESIVVVDSDGDQQEYSGSRAKRKGRRDRSSSRHRDRSSSRYRSRSRERHRESRYHSKVRDRDRGRGRKRDRSRRRRRDYDSSDSYSGDDRYRFRDYDRDMLFTSEEDLDLTDEEKREQHLHRRKSVRARSRSLARPQSRQIISMGPPLTLQTPQVDGEALQRLKEEQEAFAQQVVERDGIAIWRAWCQNQKFEDGDWITPDKLTAYVDREITSRERVVVPTQSIVGSFVRPVLRLWSDQTAGKSSGGTSSSSSLRLQEFSKHMQTLASNSSVDLSASSPSHHSASDSKPGLYRMGESVISDLKQAQQDAKARGITGMLVDPLLVGLLQDQFRFIQALVTRESPAHSGSRSILPAAVPSPSHHHMSPSPVATRPTARSKRHPSQKNKAARFPADKIELPIWFGKDRFTELKPPRTYRMNPNVQTVQGVLTEWLEGIDGAPSIQELNTKYRMQWRDLDPVEQRILNTRRCIIKEYKRLVLEAGKPEKDALELMERDASGLSLRTYADKIRTDINERKRNQESTKVRPIRVALVKAAADPPRRGNKNTLDEDSKSGEDSASESSSAEESGQSFEDNSAANPTSATAAARRNTTQRAPRNRRRSTITKVSHDFPFPVNHLSKVSDIWQEWHKGWNGGPPLEQLIEQHGRLFYKHPFTQYKHVFWAKQKIVKTLDQLTKDGVLTKEQAFHKMEYYRDNRKAQTFAAVLRDIDWTKPLPSDYEQHSTRNSSPQHQQLDPQEETQQRHSPQQEPLQQEPLQQTYQSAEDQRQELLQQLQDDPHSDGGPVQEPQDEPDKHPAFMDIAHADIRSVADSSTGRVELDVSYSTQSYEQDRSMSPSSMVLSAERSELITVSDTARSPEQDALMLPTTVDELTVIKQGSD